MTSSTPPVSAVPASPRQRRRGTISLRRQLTVLGVALVAPLLLLQTWWSVHDYRSARQHAEENALAVADAIALGVTQFFMQTEELMTATTAQMGTAWVTPSACPLQMRSVVDLFPFLHNAVAVDGDGVVVCSARPAPESASAREWPWFDAVRSRPEFTIGEPVIADFSGEWILPLVAPVVGDDGAFLGAVVGSVALVELSRLFGGVAIPEDHLVTVATADRTIIARSSDPEGRVGDRLPPLTGSDREVAPGRWVASGPDLTGVDRTWGQVEIEPGWIVYVGVPNTVVFGPARREALVHVGATLLVVLLGILLAARSYARIAEALRELARRTRSAASGAIVPLPPETPLEVSEVVEQFNHTLAARNRAEASERAARMRFESLFDNAVVGLYVSTADGRFMQVNQHLVHMLGYASADELLEAGPGALYLDANRRKELIAKSVGTGTVATEELEWVRADGSGIVVRVGGKLVPGPQGESVFEMIVQDVTEEKRTEEELRQTQKMEAIGQLAGGIAHDFNNILTVIGGNVELLEEELAPDHPLREDLAQIAKATGRAAALTGRLLAFSRKQRRGLKRVDVNEVVPDLTRMLAPLLGEQVTLSFEPGPGPYLINIDPGEFEQVLLNLVLNARDAMPRGGQVTISTRASDGAGVGIAAKAGAVLLTVEDSGIGMDPATRTRIFEPFYTTKPMGEGTGLGLSTVYAIVRRSGGTVEVESELGRGTRMSVWLPLAAASESAEERSVPIDATRSAKGSETVLVVEDDDMVRRFVERSLSEVGYRVLATRSIEEAMDVFRTRDDEIQLVLTDVVMPGAGGSDLAERLALVAPGLPVLFMSGYVDDRFLHTELERAPDQILRKPFTPSELRTRVRRALDHQSAGTPGA